MAKIYDPAHLSVLRLIKLSSDSAKKVGVPISVCGEMAGDTMFTSLLLGMGIKTLSMSISRILKVKQFITCSAAGFQARHCANHLFNPELPKTRGTAMPTRIGVHLYLSKGFGQ